MTSARSRVNRHLARMKKGLIAASFLSLAPSVVACDPGPPPAHPAVEPSTATVRAEGVIEAVLLPPQGGWRVSEVEVEGAKIVSRSGDDKLLLALRRSEPKQGETTVLSADEPIKIKVHYTNQEHEEVLTFTIDAKGTEPDGTTVKVDASW